MIFSGLIKPLIDTAATGVAAVSATSVAAPSSDSCDALTDSNCLRKSIKGLDWGQSFGATNPAKVGQNLYDTIYYKMKYKPLDKAINATAAQYGLVPETMSVILSGDISPILNQKPYITIESAQNIFQTMQASYIRNKRDADLVADLKIETEPAEIFADGNINDSGFDLINDLNNIEIILFKQNDLVSFGHPYSPSGISTGGASSTPTMPNLKLNTSGNKIPGGIIGENGGISNSGANSSGSGANSGSGLNSGSDLGISNPFNSINGSNIGGINPNICFVGDDLKKALYDLEQSKKQNKSGSGVNKIQQGIITSSNSGSGSGSGSGVNSGSSSGSGVNSDVGVGQIAKSKQSNKLTGSHIKEVQPAPTGNYQTNPLCGKIFCLTVDFVSAPVKPAFDEIDNCIECHIEYINDKLQKTLSHDLTPAKVSGNFGETSTCKRAAGIALGNIGLNVAFQPVPMITPVKNDLMTLSSTTEEWNKFWANNAFWNYTETERKRLDADFNNMNYQTSSLSENITQQILNSDPDNASLSFIATRIATTANQINQQQRVTALLGKVGSSVYQEAETQNDLATEMKTMNGYFRNMRNVIRSLSSIVPGMNSSLACQKLKNKKACT